MQRGSCARAQSSFRGDAAMVLDEPIVALRKRRQILRAWADPLADVIGITARLVPEQEKPPEAWAAFRF